MRIEVDRFSFAVPPGFDDQTNYTFRDSGDNRLLSVSSDPIPEGVRDLAGLMADRRNDLNRLGPGAAKVEGEHDGAVGDWPARILRFTFEDKRKGEFREYWAVAFDSPKTYVQLSYATPAKDRDTAERFAHVLRSVSLVEAGGKAPQDFVRRQAGKFALDVPANLAPPRNYAFASPDETTQLSLRIVQPVVSQVPTLEEEAEKEHRPAGSIRSKETSSFTTGPFAGTSLAYVLSSETPDGDVTDACRRMSLTAEGVNVHVFGRAPVAEANRLEQVLAAWLSTFALKR